jgi:hypothetical protein
LNALVTDYWTPAHHAVEHEDTETLARLLADGTDPDEVFSNMTLLTHAIDVEGDGSLQSGQPLTVHTTAVLLAFGLIRSSQIQTVAHRWTWPIITATTWQ